MSHNFKNLAFDTSRFLHLASDYWSIIELSGPEGNVQRRFYLDFNLRFQMEKDRKSQVWPDRTHASLCLGLSEIIPLLWKAQMNPCAVVSDGIRDEYDNTPSLSLWLFPWKPSEPNKSCQSFSQSLPWLIDLYFFKKTASIHLAMRTGPLEHALVYRTPFPSQNVSLEKLKLFKVPCLRSVPWTFLRSSDSTPVLSKIASLGAFLRM